MAKTTVMFRTCLGISVLLSFAAALASAQWIGHPTADVPRTKDGKPNLTAPAPRDAEGHPDLSGLWAPDRSGDRPAAPNTNPLQNIRGLFWDIGWNIDGGLPYQPWAREVMEKRRADFAKDNPDVRCLPLGPIQMHTHNFIRKYEQLPGELVILHERDLEFRQIFTDGRPLPIDPQPTFNGYSSGKWEKDELVVQTSGFRDGLWADYNGSPLTDAAKITERFRRPDFGHMTIDITVDDPKAYTKPWTARVNLMIALNNELIEYLCVENEKDARHMVGK